MRRPAETELHKLHCAAKWMSHLKLGLGLERSLLSAQEMKEAEALGAPGAWPGSARVQCAVQGASL